MNFGLHIVQYGLAPSEGRSVLTKDVAVLPTIQRFQAQKMVHQSEVWLD